MNWYTQLDDRWATKILGNTEFICRVLGCHVVSLANILLHAGRWETPETLIDIFNKEKIFLDIPYELETFELQKKFPIIQYTPDANYSIIRGSFLVDEGKTYSHFLAKMPDGLIVDSFGLEGYPKGFREMYRMNIRVVK